MLGPEGKPPPSAIFYIPHVMLAVGRRAARDNSSWGGAYLLSPVDKAPPEESGLGSRFSEMVPSSNEERDEETSAKWDLCDKEQESVKSRVDCATDWNLSLTNFSCLLQDDAICIWKVLLDWTQQLITALRSPSVQLD